MTTVTLAAPPACLIVQPIHQTGIKCLREAGLLPVDRIDAVDPGRIVAAITRNAGFSGEQMKALTELRIVAVHGVGHDPVDTDIATRLGIAVTNTPGSNERSVAEQAIALMFGLTKRLVAADGAARKGDFSFKYSADLMEIAGLTLGILGFGAIGRQTAAIGRALGMRVIAFSNHQDDRVFDRSGVLRASTLEAVLGESDVVSLHLPATSSTRNMIGRQELALMKPTSFLINTGRGSTVDEDALVEALRSGKIRGAGLDVFQSEPLTPDHPLCSLPNVILSPHLAGSTEAALERTAVAAADCVLSVLADRQPATLLNPQVWAMRRSSPIGI